MSGWRDDGRDGRRIGVSGLHALLGDGSLVLGAVAAVWAVVLVLLRRDGGALFGGLVLVLLVAMIATAAVGAVTAATQGPPVDGLHYVYAALALVTLPAVGIISTGRPIRTRAIILTIALVVLVVLLFRLLQTG